MAEMTAARRAALMAYCRLDELDEGESALLEVIYHSAVSYMMQAGISEPPEGTPRRAQYDLCVNAMVLDAWDRRGVADSVTFTDNGTYSRYFDQLQLTEYRPENADEAIEGNVSNLDTLPQHGG